MAVTNINNKATYACDGTTKTFDLAVKVFALSDVVVSVKRLSTGAVTTLTVDVDYTSAAISGSLESGVRITTLPATAYSSDYTITLLRTIATTQNLELEVGGDLPANELEDALDRGVMISQQITERSNRSLQFPVTDPTGTTYTAGTTEERANKACGYDANGNVTELDLAAAGAVAVDTNKGLSLASNIISAKADDSSIEFGSLGEIQVKDLGITAGKLANGAVTLAKIADAALSGADATLITGTAGTTNSTAKWNADGDLVDGYPVLDEDDMASDSATSLATQQSIKAYNKVLQVVTAQTKTKVYQASAVIPSDASIPQITEGLEVFSQAFTPKSATSRILIETNIVFGAYGAAHITTLFKDAGANAIATNLTNMSIINYTQNSTLTYYETSESTTARTYSIRIGTEEGGVTLNGLMNDTVLFGGTLTSTLTITELQ
jgi:hypothetical protein